MGDAVLEVVSSDFLYHKYRRNRRENSQDPCQSGMRAEHWPTARQIWNWEAICSWERGEEATGGRERNSVVSDAMEALIGSIYLDGGFANAKEFIHRFILNDIEHKQLFYDSKTILQEMIQATAGAHLEYEILREEGPDHHKGL